MATPLQVSLAAIGFSMQQLVALDAQGIRNLDDIGLLTEDNIKEIGKRIYDKGQVDFPIIYTQKLVIIHFWRRNRVNSGQQANALSINNQLMTQQSEAYQLHHENRKLKRSNEAVVKPEKFMQPNKWRVFHDSVHAYLQNMTGVTGIPLTYVIRSQAVPTPGATYANDMEERIANAPLTGLAFSTDSHTVHGIILSLVLDGPAYSFIGAHDDTKDGRAAWLDLLAHYEGRAYMDRRKNEAYKTIDLTHYKGEKRTFDFEKYITLHQRSHEDLRAAGEPVPESRKVSVFLSNINHPSLQLAVAVVRATPTLLNDFTAMTNYLAGIVHGIKNIGRGSHRSISDVRGGGRYGGRGGRGRGGRGCGGRGRGRESLEQEVARLAQRRIQRDEWFSIPRWKQEKIKAKRRELKSERDANESTLASRISQLESRISQASTVGTQMELPPAPAQAPAPPPTPEVETTNTNDSPSQLTTTGASMFGANAHKGNRRRGQFAISTSNRTNRICNLNTTKPTSYQKEGRLELDLHADTTCAGPEV